MSRSRLVCWCCALPDVVLSCFVLCGIILSVLSGFALVVCFSWCASLALSFLLDPDIEWRGSYSVKHEGSHLDDQSIMKFSAVTFACVSVPFFPRMVHAKDGWSCTTFERSSVTPPPPWLGVLSYITLLHPRNELISELVVHSCASLLNHTSISVNAALSPSHYQVGRRSWSVCVESVAWK